MAGEAQILTPRRNADPPQRHRDHGDDPGFGHERDSACILSALRVWVVKTRLMDEAIVQNKANLRRATSALTAVRKKGYDENRPRCPCRKQSQFHPATPTETAGSCTASQGRALRVYCATVGKWNQLERNQTCSDSGLYEIAQSASSVCPLCSE